MVACGVVFLRRLGCGEQAGLGGEGGLGGVVGLRNCNVGRCLDGGEQPPNSDNVLVQPFGVM